MESDTLIDWNDEGSILSHLNEEIYEIAEDQCVSAYQRWRILNCVKEVMVKKAYFSAISYIAGRGDDAKALISRAEGYRCLYDLYYENIIEHTDPTMDEDDYREYSGKVSITVFMGEDKEVFDSIGLFVSYMMSTENWFAPERFLIKWKETGMKSEALFDSADTDRWG